VVNKADRTVICTAFSEGKKHDFRLYKDSRLRCGETIVEKTDTGYVGIKNIHSNSVLPYKKSKNQPLTKEQKRENRVISRERVLNEHAIGFIKRFRILAEKYRNRRKRFGLRFNLIAGICNFELKC
jgi:hypothetical protein